MVVSSSVNDHLFGQVVKVSLSRAVDAGFKSCLRRPSRWPSGRASASRAEDPGFEPRLRRDFFRVESHQ